MKKFVSMMLTGCFCFGILSGCASDNETYLKNLDKTKVEEIKGDKQVNYAR